MKPRLIHPSYFIWLIVPAIVFALYQAWGLPHLIWNYQYHGTKNTASFRYIACSYIGPTGGYWRDASNGKCSLVSFRKTSGSSAR